MAMAALTSCADGGRVEKAASTSVPESAYVPTPKPPEGNRITLADAKKEFDSGTAVFVDVRSPESFEKERVKGSLNIMISQLPESLGKLKTSRKIVVYCSCAAEHSSLNWVIEAAKLGVKNAFALVGGTQAWVDAGFPVDKK